MSIWVNTLPHRSLPTPLALHMFPRVHTLISYSSIHFSLGLIMTWPCLWLLRVVCRLGFRLFPLTVKELRGTKQVWFKNKVLLASSVDLRLGRAEKPLTIRARFLLVESTYSWWLLSPPPLALWCSCALSGMELGSTLLTVLQFCTWAWKQLQKDPISQGTGTKTH